METRPSHRVLGKFVGTLKENPAKQMWVENSDLAISYWEREHQMDGMSLDTHLDFEKDMTPQGLRFQLSTSFR